MRLFVLLFSLILPTASHAGELLEGYLFVVASISAEIPASTERDISQPIFRNTISALTNEWQNRCGIDVRVWHTDLMSSEKSYWPASQWIVYAAFEPTAEQSRNAAPISTCTSAGFAQHAYIVIPTAYQQCANLPEIKLANSVDCN